MRDSSSEFISMFCIRWTRGRFLIVILCMSWRGQRRRRGSSIGVSILFPWGWTTSRGCRQRMNNDIARRSRTRPDSSVATMVGWPTRRITTTAPVLGLGCFTLLPCLAFFGIVRGYPVKRAELAGLGFLVTNGASRWRRSKLGVLQAWRGNSNRRKRTFCINGSSIQAALLVVEGFCCEANKNHIILVIGRGKRQSNIDRACQVRGKNTQEVRYQRVGATNTRPDAQGWKRSRNCSVVSLCSLKRNECNSSLALTLWSWTVRS